MNPARLMTFLLAGWGIAFAGSFIAYWQTAPDDFGFTAGLNRLEVFFTWQVVAFVLGVLCLTTSRSLDPAERLRRFGLVPLGITALGLAVLVAFTLWMAFMQPRPDPADTSLPPKPVTATTELPPAKSPS